MHPLKLINLTFLKAISLSIAGVIPVVGTADVTETGIEEMIIFGDYFSFALTPDVEAGGAVWVDHLADTLGIARATAYTTEQPDGSNFARLPATADADLSFLPGTIEEQITAYLENRVSAPDADTLIVFWCGTVDLLRPDPEAADGFVSPLETANAVLEQLTRLVEAGAGTVLIPEVLPMGLFPFATIQEDPALWFDRANAFNQQLALHLATLRQAYPDRTFIHGRFHNYFAHVAEHPSAFGFIDISTASRDPFNVIDPIEDFSEYLWYTEKGPTSAGHQLLAQYAALEIAAALDPASAGALDLRIGKASEDADWTVSLTGPALPVVDLEYSTDCNTWQQLERLFEFDGTHSLTLTVESDENLFLRVR